jgi:hypothetical protein
MSEWKTLLNGDLTDWLPEDLNPSVRYFTLRWILELQEGDPNVSTVVQSVTQSAPIQQLLSRQRPEGYWEYDDRPHHGTKRFLVF